ncbi:hypothetical protein [Flavobacterium sp.]|uniref:hypothetical protein n=1 Tax=Flavobacterium sp. TaxID=239 RepID=UPI00263401C8|nr:hypothetical protein [Flavobacterium sp.]
MTEINFNQLWQSHQNIPEIDAATIVLQAQQMQRKTKIKLLLGNLLLFATMIFIIGIVVYFKPEMITTKIGSLLVIIAILMQIIASMRLIPLVNKSNAQTNPEAYLNQLLAFKKKQAFIQSTIMTLYFLFLSVGLALYMIEYTLRGSIFFILATYGTTMIWIAFNWFYIRPRTIRKQEQKLNEAIRNLENITGQFVDETTSKNNL